MKENRDIEEVKETLKKSNCYIETTIQGINIYFGGEKITDVSDEMIEFALDLVEDYIRDPQKYDCEVVKTIMNFSDGEFSKKTIMQKLGKPEMFIDDEDNASLDYDSIEEIGDHMPEVRVDGDLEIYDVVLNG